MKIQSEQDTKNVKGIVYPKTTMNRFDRVSPSKKSGFGCPEHTWHSPSNGRQITNENQLNRMKSGYIPKQPSPTNKQEPYKFYAPVQIIAPTVYFSSNQSNANKMILKVNEYDEGSRGFNPEAKRQSEREVKGGHRLNEVKNV